MAHTYCSLLFHCVFSTKERRKWIAEDVRERLWAYIGGIAREHEMKALAVGGMEDHVHSGRGKLFEADGFVRHAIAAIDAGAEIRAGPNGTAGGVVGAFPGISSRAIFDSSLPGRREKHRRRAAGK